MNEQKPNLMNLSVLIEIADAFARITDGHIARIAGRLSESLPGEQPPGTVHSDEARRLWATADYFDRLAVEQATRGKFDAASRAEMEECVAQSKRYAAFEDLTRDLFWLAVKCDIGGGAWTADEIGVRSGWMLVARKRSRTAQLLGGLQLPPGFPFAQGGEED